MAYNFLWFLLVLLLGNNIQNVHAQCNGVVSRRSWRAMNCAQRTAYLDAVQALKDLPQQNNLGIPNYDDFVRIHVNNNNFAHGVDTFLPWHRWFTYIFERALQRVSGNCNIFVPFWDWELDARNPSNAKVFENDTFGTRNGRNNQNCVMDGVASSWISERGNCLQREFNENVAFADESILLDVIINSETFAEFRPRLEGMPHSAPHVYLGAQMDTPFSPDDPLFYLHHSNIDRIWAIWSDYHRHNRIARDELRQPQDFPGGGNSLGLDDELPFDGSRYSNFFTMPGSNRYPTPRDLHHMIGGNAIVQTRYVNDGLAFALNQVTRNDGADAYSTRNDPNWIGIGGGRTTTVECQMSPTQLEPEPQPEPEPEPEPQPQPQPEPEEFVTCLEAEFRCQDNRECCSNQCHWWWRVCLPPQEEEEVPAPEPEPEEPEPEPETPPQQGQCIIEGFRCQDDGECCSNQCHWWWRVCLPPQEEEEVPAPEPEPEPEAPPQQGQCIIEGWCTGNNDCCSNACVPCWGPWTCCISTRGQNGGGGRSLLRLSSEAKEERTQAIIDGGIETRDSRELVNFGDDGAIDGVDGADGDEDIEIFATGYLSAHWHELKSVPDLPTKFAIQLLRNDSCHQRGDPIWPSESHIKMEGLEDSPQVFFCTRD